MPLPAELTAFRARLAAAADPAHASFHQAYHKSAMPFYGVRTPQLRRFWREQWPARPRLERARVLPLLDPLWHGSFEEATTALYLLSRIVGQLTPDDLPLLHGHTRRCQGWGHLDFLALEVLGPLALQHGAAAHAPVAGWLDDDWLWTRRSAILIHCRAARVGRLDPAYAWPACAARLHEKEFFIRKAIGWTLRECCRHYPQDVARFVAAHRGEISGLTLREATRKLPPELRPLLPPA
jgi:3-methyladenine DNA glycosylase AlkD